MLTHVAHLGCNGLWVVVAHPCPSRRIVEPRHLSVGFPVPRVLWVAKTALRQNPPIAVHWLPTGRRSSTSLEEAVIDIRHSTVTVSIKRNPDQQLIGGYSGVEKRPHARIHIEPGRRISFGGVQGRVEVRGPRSRVIVIGHHVDEVQQWRDARDLEVRDFLRAGRRGDRQLVVPMILETLAVELSPELREEQGKILSVDGTLDISFHSAGNGKFPVDVDSVKKSWVLADKEIDRRLRKQPPARIGERDVGESSGAGPATDRDGQLQVAVPR